jgi:outer membrane immunogenic protein
MSNLLELIRRRARPLGPTAGLLATILALFANEKTAVAADMPMPTKAPAVAARYQWSGCYVGLNGGGGTVGSNFTTNVGAGGYLPPGPPSDPLEVSNDGTGSRNGANAVGGGQIGCNWQSNTIVFGVEGDFDYFRSTAAYINNTDTLPNLGFPFAIGQSLTTNYLATVRPRIGIAADRNLAYITGGVAFTRASYAESYSDSNGGAGAATYSQSLTGWVAGAGWEYAVTDHWLFRAEYLIARFPKINASGAITAPGGGTSNPLIGSADLLLQIARAGVNYKF